MSLQHENVRCTWRYHQSARLIKSDSLFAVVVDGASWSGEIIFLHVLLNAFLFTRPHFLFVSGFLFTNRLILSSPSQPFLLLLFKLCHSVSYCGCRLYISCFSSFDLPAFLSPPLPTLADKVLATLLTLFLMKT